MIFHSPFDNRYSDRILVSRVPAEKFSEVEFSPNRAYWFAVRQPNYLRPSRLSTQLFVHNERPYLLRIELRDHSNGEVKINWIDEKLMHVRVWWGRILGSDLIVDVESERWSFGKCFMMEFSLFSSFSNYAQDSAGRSEVSRVPQCAAAPNAGSN